MFADIILGFIILVVCAILGSMANLLEDIYPGGPWTAALEKSTLDAYNFPKWREDL